jgi:hypothetical protein
MTLPSSRRREFFRQFLSLAFIALVTSTFLGLIAHRDAVRQEFSNARYNCASDLSELLGVTSSRAQLADRAARGNADADSLEQSDGDSTVWWNRVAASCYQYGLLAPGENDRVADAFVSAQSASLSALAASNNTVTTDSETSSGAKLVDKSVYWVMAALAQVRDASDEAPEWWPFGWRATPKVDDFVFGCAVRSDGSRAQAECNGS